MRASYPTPESMKRARKQAAARDVKSRGGNPVQVSDLKQRNGVGNTKGRSFLTTLLRGGGR